MAEGAAGRGGRGRGRGAAGGRGEVAAAAGLPVFCRQRHFVRGANVYSVPLWDLTSRWMPDELKALAAPSRLFGGGAAGGAAGAAAAGAAAVGAAAAGAAAGGYPAEGGGSAAEAAGPRPAEAEPGDRDAAPEGEAKAGDSDAEGGDDDNAPSDSEQSEIAWEGPLGHESRVWSRAGVEGGLLLLRRMAAAAPGAAATEAEGDGDGDCATPSAPSTYGLALSSALFPPSAHAAGADAPLDKRLAEVLRMREPRWAVCALRSGHFAGAVFQGQEAVVHKAIHRYTIRAKSGGSQSAQDSTKRTKSAGSNLRRYGEQRLREEIKELITDKWAAELASCELVLVSVSKRMRASLLGTEKEPYLPAASTSKVRKLPFMVGRPTFEAVREAYLKVASVIFVEERHIDALTSRFRPAPQALRPEEQQAKEDAAAARSAAKKAQEEEEAPRVVYDEATDELYTPLHAAAAAGDEDNILELLDDGADPTAQDGKGRVPYFLAHTQRSRDAFRRWRGANEEAFDWDDAKVPEGITEESEQRKKDKEKEKKKRQKEKQKANKAQAKEDEEARKKKEEEEQRALEAAQAKCDSCKKPLLSKPFARLTYLYCSPECVNAHRRELQAEAALKRFGGGP